VRVTAGDAERRVMVADRLLARALQEAVNLAVGVVIELDLPHAELVGSPVPRSLGYLVDGFLRQLQILVKIHEPGHVIPPGSRQTATVHRLRPHCPYRELPPQLTPSG
jgi:hypothetical protein